MRFEVALVMSILLYPAAFGVHSQASSGSITATSTATAASASSSATLSSYNETAILSSGYLDLGAWQSAYDQAAAFISGLTNDEKIQIITGQDVSSSNWTAMVFLDSAVSPLNHYYVSAFPVGLAAAMTWDKGLIYKQYQALAAEHWGIGTQVINGPCDQPMGRVYWGGRNAESFGPDPYLNGIAFGQAVSAMTSQGIIAGGKHFLLNEQEANREYQSSGGMGGGGGPGGGGPGGDAGSGSSIPSGSSMASATSSAATTSSTSLTSESSLGASYNSIVDDKALHETYLWPFYDGVKNGVGSVMCAMNRINESYACENAPLLNKYLKTEIGFPGIVIADVSGQKTAFGSANGGLDYGSSSTWSNTTLLEGISNGTFSQERLDDMAIRNVMLYYFGDWESQPESGTDYTYYDVRGNHSEIIREVGAASMALLKNTNNALPLNKPRTMAIFGVHAGPGIGGPNLPFTVGGEDSVYQGHLTTVGGSGAGSLPYAITPQAALSYQAYKDQTMFRWMLNDTYSGAASDGGDAAGGSAAYVTGTGTSLGFTAYATEADVCLCFINANAGEGADRSELRNTDQDNMVTTVAATCNNTIVIVNSAGPRIIDAWADNENVTAILYGALLGQESGNAIMDVLYGTVNPSGRLAHTIPKNESDVGQFAVCHDLDCSYSEGNYLDYKWFVQQGITPSYWFGHGLSYTTFNYGDLTVASSRVTSGYASGTPAVGGLSDLWNEVAQLTVTITNNGTRDGSEVAQLYVSFPAEADQPERILRGFEKLAIAAGDSSTATFSLRKRDLAYWDVSAQAWKIAAGDYTLYAATSYEDIRTQTALTVA